MAYLDQSEITAAYEAASSSAGQFFDNYKEYERIASNDLMAKLPKNMPKVNDGSLAALLRETAKRILNELPVGKAKVWERKEEWLDLLAQIVLEEKILKNANAQAPFATKLEIGFHKALVYGGQPYFAFLKSKGEYKCADFILPYAKDVYLEPGKTSDQDSDYMFLVSYYTKLQVKQIIEAAEQEEKDAKAQKREPEGGWNIAELKKVLTKSPSGKDSASQNQEERNKSNYSEVYKFVTCFQRGFESPFYTFFEEPKATQPCIVREAKNEDPTGDLPIIYQYGDQDLMNPYGVSQIKVSGGTQNVLDYLTQLHVLSTQLGLQPPVRIAGDRSSTNLASMVYAPRQFWFVGNAQVEPVQVSGQIHANFPTAYGLYKTQLMNLQGTTDASVSAESGQPTYSRTPAGVKFQAQRQSATDSFWRKQVFRTYERLVTKLLNIEFNSMHGTEILKLSQENATKLMLAGLIDQDPETKQPSVDEIALEWDKLRGKIAFQVDADASIEQDSEAERAALGDMIKMALQFPQGLQAIESTGRRLDLGEAMKRYFLNLRMKDPEKLLPEIKPDENKQLGQIMGRYGVDERTAKVVGQALGEGIPEEAIVDWLQNGQGAAEGAAPGAPATAPNPEGEAVVGTPIG